jgi:hypothetical protein
LWTVQTRILTKSCNHINIFFERKPFRSNAMSRAFHQRTFENNCIFFSRDNFIGANIAHEIRPQVSSWLLFNENCCSSQERFSLVCTTKVLSKKSNDDMLLPFWSSGARTVDSNNNVVGRRRRANDKDNVLTVSSNSYFILWLEGVREKLTAERLKLN